MASMSTSPAEPTVALDQDVRDLWLNDRSRETRNRGDLKQQLRATLLLIIQVGGNKG